jgi:hypothetical protein
MPKIGDQNNVMYLSPEDEPTHFFLIRSVCFVFFFNEISRIYGLGFGLAVVFKKQRVLALGGDLNMSNRRI